MFMFWCFSMSEYSSVQMSWERFRCSPILSSFPSFAHILYLLYAFLIQIPVKYHYCLTHQAELLLQLLTNHLKTASHQLLLKQTSLRYSQPPRCHCSPRSHPCCFLMLQFDVKVNLEQEKTRSNTWAQQLLQPVTMDDMQTSAGGWMSILRNTDACLERSLFNPW